MPQRTALACAILAALTLPAFAHDRDESETLAPITVSAAREDSPLNPARDICGQNAT